MKKRRHILSIAVLVFIMAVGLIGCGGSDSGSGETIEFVVGSVETTDSTTAQAMEEFEKTVEEETDGAVDVQVHHDGALGGEREILEGVELGTIHLAFPGSTQFEQYGDKFGLLVTPFLFPTLDSFQSALAGDVGETYTGWLNEEGFNCYGYVPAGFRGLANSVRPVTTPEDVEGLKIRVMEGATYVDTFDALGATTSTMAYNEVYTALQQGTIDGQDNPPQYNVDAGFYELQPYYTRLNHTMSHLLYITSAEFMDSLDPEVKEIIENALYDAVEKHTELNIAADEEYLQEMKNYGNEVTELTDDQMQLFIDKVQGIWDNVRENVGNDVFDMALSYSK